MQPTSIPSSRLPTLRPEQRSNPLTYDGPPLHPTTGGPSHVSSSTIASAHRALQSRGHGTPASVGGHAHSRNNHTHNQQPPPQQQQRTQPHQQLHQPYLGSSRSRDSYRSNPTTSTTTAASSNMYSLLTSDAAASHSLSSLYNVSASDSSVHPHHHHANNNNSSSNKTGSSSAAGAARLRFPHGTLPHPRGPGPSPSLFNSPPPPPASGIMAASATTNGITGAAPDTTDAPAGAPPSVSAAPLSHLEYTGPNTSLSPHSYLPQLAASSLSSPIATPSSPLQQQQQQQQASQQVSLTMDASDGLMTLQDATTGLLVRHLSSEIQEGPGREAAVTVAAAGGAATNANVRDKTNNRGDTNAKLTTTAAAAAAYDAARTNALKHAAPFVSAALLDAGVDDRINPLVLDKMIRQGRRRFAATTAAASAAAAADTRNTSESARAKTLLSPNAAQNAAAAAKRQAAASPDSVASTQEIDETRYHEPPALQAAYGAMTADGGSRVDDDPKKRATNKGQVLPPQSIAEGDAFAEILAEYANDATGEEFAPGTPRSSPLLKAKRAAAAAGVSTSTAATIGATQRGEVGGGGMESTWNSTAGAAGHGKAMLLMSSPDYTRLASAASANDAAFIRQLVNYYTTRARATTAAAAAAAQQRSKTTKGLFRSGGTRVPLSAAALESVKSGQQANSTLTTSNDVSAAAAAAAPAQSFPQHFNSGTDFSLLNAVLSVSREYVEVQASENGLPGRGTAALSERRRHLLRQLVTLEQTRIPESLWVTCAPPLSRLTALTTSPPSSSAGALLPGQQTASAQRDEAHARDGIRITPGSGSNALAATAPLPAVSSGTFTTVSSAGGRVLTAGGEGGLDGTLRRAGSDLVRASVEAASIVATQREDSVHNSQRARNAQNNNNDSYSAGGGTTVANTIFPAARPTDRSQVYLLADVLDRMLHDPAHPQWVELLSNPEVARYVFAEEDEEGNGDDNANGARALAAMRRESHTPAGAGEAESFAYSEEANDTYENVWGPPGEQRLMAYTDAAHQVLDILDAGLSELVRQVTCHCTERGALLDVLRQSVVDIAATQVHLLSQVKRQARQDAATALALRAENHSLQAQCQTAKEELEALKATHAQLQARIEPIQRKSDRLDELMARVASKARRFETHRHDEHIALLQLLEESMKQTASAAADNFYNEVNDMHVRHVKGDSADPYYGITTNASSSNNNNNNSVDAFGNGAYNIPLMLEAEMPSVAAARTHAAEQRQTMSRMYGEAHQLLRALQDTVEATNAVCAPLYKKMILTDVSPIAKVATSKWTTIARAVGAFEKEKRHRQRVYEVFTEYCTVFRHEQAAANRNGGTTTTTNARQNSNVFFGDSNMSAGLTVQSYGESFLVDHSSANRKGSGAGNENASDNADDVNGTLRALQRRVPQPDAPGTNLDGAGSSSSTSANPFGAIISHSDLEAMSATDCTVEEVNALFRKDFDMRAYLRGSWEDFIHDRRLREATSGVDDAYTLRLPDLLQMLCDLHATLAEVTMRMRAMADSGVLQVLLRPPLEPPAHPEVPCPLCSRRDGAEMDRQRRREAMSRIARDLQGKMDAVEAKSRAAQLERDEAKREVRRLQMELQQVSKGNLPASSSHSSSHGKSTSGAAGHSNVRNSSMSSFRRVRRDTSTPRNANLPRDPSFANASTRSNRTSSNVSGSNNGNGAGNAGPGSSGNPSRSRTRQSSRKSSYTAADGNAPSRPSSSHHTHAHRQPRSRRNTREGEEEADGNESLSGGDSGGNNNSISNNTDVGMEDVSMGRSTSFGTAVGGSRGAGASFVRSGGDEDDEEEIDGEGATAIPSNRRATAAM